MANNPPSNFHWGANGNWVRNDGKVIITPSGQYEVRQADGSYAKVDSPDPKMAHSVAATGTGASDRGGGVGGTGPGGNNEGTPISPTHMPLGSGWHRVDEGWQRPTTNGGVENWSDGSSKPSYVYPTKQGTIISSDPQPPGTTVTPTRPKPEVEFRNYHGHRQEEVKGSGNWYNVGPATGPDTPIRPAVGISDALHVGQYPTNSTTAKKQAPGISDALGVGTTTPHKPVVGISDALGIGDYPKKTVVTPSTSAALHVGEQQPVAAHSTQIIDSAKDLKDQREVGATLGNPDPYGDPSKVSTVTHPHPGVTITTMKNGDKFEQVAGASPYKIQSGIDPLIKNALRNEGHATTPVVAMSADTRAPTVSTTVTPAGGTFTATPNNPRALLDGGAFGVTPAAATPSTNPFAGSGGHGGL